MKLGLFPSLAAWCVRQSALQRINQVLDRNMSAQLAAVGVGVLTDPDMEA